MRVCSRIPPVISGRDSSPRQRCTGLVRRSAGESLEPALAARLVGVVTRNGLRCAPWLLFGRRAWWAVSPSAVGRVHGRGEPSEIPLVAWWGLM